MGNAASFHTLFARLLRYEALKGLKSAVASGELTLPEGLVNIECIPDRQCFRPAGVVPTAEAWHRDLSPVGDPLKHVRASPGDLILGGWINCNADHDQVFTCCPRTHHESARSEGDAGFVRAPRGDYPEKTVVIPPGHALYFVQDLLHTVTATKLAFDMRRMYIAARFTASDRPFIKGISEILRLGAIVPLKSGQMPPMYPKLWPVNWKDRLEAFSKRFPEDMLTNGVLNRYAPPRKPEYAYTEEEHARHRPQPLEFPVGEECRCGWTEDLGHCEECGATYCESCECLCELTTEVDSEGSASPAPELGDVEDPMEGEFPGLEREEFAQPTQEVVDLTLDEEEPTPDKSAEEEPAVESFRGTIPQDMRERLRGVYYLDRGAENDCDMRFGDYIRRVRAYTPEKPAEKTLLGEYVEYLEYLKAEQERRAPDNLRQLEEKEKAAEAEEIRAATLPSGKCPRVGRKQPPALVHAARKQYARDLGWLEKYRDTEDFRLPVLRRGRYEMLGLCGKKFTPLTYTQVNHFIAMVYFDDKYRLDLEGDIAEWSPADLMRECMDAWEEGESWRQYTPVNGVVYLNKPTGRGKESVQTCVENDVHLERMITQAQAAYQFKYPAGGETMQKAAHALHLIRGVSAKYPGLEVKLDALGGIVVKKPLKKKRPRHEETWPAEDEEVDPYTLPAAKK